MDNTHTIAAKLLNKNYPLGNNTNTTTTTNNNNRHAKQIIATRLLQGYQLKGNGEICFCCAMPLMLPPMKKDTEKDTKEEQRDDIRHGDDDNNSPVKDEIMSNIGVDVDQQQEGVKSNSGGICVVCQEDHASAADFERKLVIFTEQHALNIDESIDESIGDNSHMRVEEENNSDMEAEDSDTEEIDSSDRQHRPNLKMKEKFGGSEQELGYISNIDATPPTEHNNNKIEVTARKRCKTCAMDIPTTDNGEECQFCQVAKQANDDSINNGEEDLLGINININVDNIETMSSVLTSTNNNFDLGTCKEEVEGLYVRQQELKMDEKEEEVEEVEEGKKDEVKKEDKVVEHTPTTANEVRDATKKVNIPSEIILQIDTTTTTTTTNIAKKKDDNEKVDDAAIILKKGIKLLHNTKGEVEMLLLKQNEVPTTTKENDNIAVEQQHITSHMAVQTNNEVCNSNEAATAVQSNEAPANNSVVDKTNIHPSQKHKSRDKTKVVKGYITKMLLINYQRHQLNNNTLKHTNGNNDDDGDDRIIEKKDLYSDLLACNVSKETVKKLQHLLGEDVALVLPEMVTKKQPTHEHQTADGPICKDVVLTIKTNPTQIDDVEVESVPINNNIKIDPPSAKDPPPTTTESAYSILKDPKKTCDRTRNDTISVLASYTKRQGVSSEHLSTVDEDSIRQRLTKFHLQFSNSGEEYRQPANKASSYVMSSAGGLASISEIGSTYTINSSSIVDKGVSHTKQQHVSHLSPTAISRRQHYKRELMARRTLGVVSYE